MCENGSERMHNWVYIGEGFFVHVHVHYIQKEKDEILSKNEHLNKTVAEMQLKVGWVWVWPYLCTISCR